MKVSRSYARSLYRWRRQAARLIVDACWLMSPTEQAYAATCRAVESGRPFNVATVRAHCEALILEADALDDERVVFMDWTRARGLGPEVRDRGAFVQSARTRKPTNTDDGLDGPRVGGWPGRLAREFAAEQRSLRRCSRKDCHGGRVGECADCLGHGFMTRYVGEGSLAGVDVPGPGFSVGLRIDCDACEGTGRNRCHECNPIKVVGIRERRPSHAFANGGNLRPAAQRLLDTLDGRCPWNSDAEAQPSECPACAGKFLWSVRTTDSRMILGSCDSRAKAVARAARDHGVITRDHWPCTACNRTGHNLRGVLPELWPGLAPRRLRGLPGGWRAMRRPVEQGGGGRVE